MNFKGIVLVKRYKPVIHNGSSTTGLSSWETEAEAEQEIQLIAEKSSNDKTFRFDYATIQVIYVPMENWEEDE